MNVSIRKALALLLALALLAGTVPAAVAAEPDETGGCAHDYQAAVTAPTCTQRGYTTYTCAKCGDSYTGDETEALGHDYQKGVCARCKAVDPDYTPFRFDDVKDSKQYYYDAVYWAYNHTPQITNGTSAKLFSPKTGCTRAQVVTFLWRAMGEPAPVSQANPFKDVKAGQYYSDAVLWAVEQGITNGTSADRFSPDSVCTRGQIVTFLWRALDKPEPAAYDTPFKDVKAGNYYFKAILWAANAGVTSGVTPTAFRPGDTCTRGQIVTFLHRVLSEAA